MSEINPLLIAKGKKEVFLYPKMANRHGLIAGATGTGKTVSLKVLSEAFSSIGVPVFLADIKGDLATISQAGGENLKIDERIKMLKLNDFSYQAFPTILWDVFGQIGHPVRTTISEMGPLLIARLLGLNETQTGVLNIIFKIADDSGLLLIDLKDLRQMLKYVGDNAGDYTLEYGNISKQSIGAIQRGLLVLEEQGGNNFFAEPALDIMDFIKTTSEGKGYINVLASEKLFESPTLYSTFLLWLLSQLFEALPEIGDPEKPRIIFFFDEAHLLFKEAPKVLIDKIEQVVRLVRSKGVGVYFVTHNPNDLPEKILGQLGNRIQHALRAYTPRELTAVKAAAETFRQNPELDIIKTITELKTGEALISFLDEEGRPSIVEQAFVLPPRSLLGTIKPEQRAELIKNSMYYNKYENTFDRESAYEILKKKFELSEREKEAESIRIEREKLRKTQERQYNYNYGRKTITRRKTDSALTKMAKSAANSVGRTVGREIVRGILGLILKK